MHETEKAQLAAYFELMTKDEREVYLDMGRVTTAGRKLRPALSLVATDSRLVADGGALRRLLN